MKIMLALLTALLGASLTTLPAAEPPKQGSADPAQKENTCEGKGLKAKCFIGGY